MDSAGVRVNDAGAEGQFQDGVVSACAVLVCVAAGFAVLGADFAQSAQGDERVEAGFGQGDDISAASAVSAVGSAAGAGALAKKSDDSIAAAPADGDDVELVHKGGASHCGAGFTRGRTPECRRRAGAGC